MQSIVLAFNVFLRCKCFFLSYLDVSVLFVLFLSCVFVFAWIIELKYGISQNGPK